MLTGAANLILQAAGLYAGVGAGFALIYVLLLMGRLDPAAGHGPIGFRLIALPAAAALWPWLLIKLLFRARR